MKNKWVLLGMNDPTSEDPRNALIPHSASSTGGRLVSLLSMGCGRPVTHEEYLGAFDRLNVLTSTTWDRADAREEGQRLRQELTGRSVLVLGMEAWRALGLPPGAPQVTEGGTTWWQLPHPSGLNRWYNDPANQRNAAGLLAQISGLH